MTDQAPERTTEEELFQYLRKTYPRASESDIRDYLRWLDDWGASSECEDEE